MLLDVSASAGERQQPRAAPPRAAEPPGPRVLMVVESSSGGTGRHVLDLCEGLLARGSEVHLVYSTGRIDRFFRDRLAALPALRHAGLPMRREIHPADTSLVKAVRRYLRENGPFDAVHGHSSKGGAVARLAAVGTGVPAFYTLHGFIIMDPGLPLWKRAFYLGIEVLLSWGTAGIIAVSPEEQRAAVRLGLGRNRVTLVPNGIRPVPPVPRAEARRALGVSDDALVVGFVGRLVDQKAPDVLLKAFARAAGEVPSADWVLAMIGSGPLGEGLRLQAADLGVADRVLWPGELDARGVLPAFDVFALSSRKEGLPYVVLEAMSAGLPVVATASAGVEILVRPGVNGYVPATDDVAAFAGALADLARDPARRTSQGAASRRLAGRFTVEAMVEGTLAAYRAAGRPRTAQPISDHPVRQTNPPTTSVVAAGPAGRPVLPPRSVVSLRVTKGASAVAGKPRSSEMHPGPGFRIRSDFIRPDRVLMDAFREFGTPDISDQLNRLYAVNPEIHCLTGPEHTLCGPALTVKVFPGDNLMVHKSLDVARPGDIVVVDASGTRNNAVLGDLISTKAKHRGIAGFIVDGLVRDLPAITELDFPVFARGTTPIGPLHRGPGEINHPICCGGIVVNPGDLIVADQAGVVVVPRGIAVELLERLEQYKDANRVYFDSVRRGTFSNAWVDRLLEDAGCQVQNEPEPAAVADAG